jgi:hypothetical protein
MEQANLEPVVIEEPCARSTPIASRVGRHLPPRRPVAGHRRLHRGPDRAPERRLGQQRLPHSLPPLPQVLVAGRHAAGCHGGNRGTSTSTTSEAAFFKNLSQQPLGPTVVDSVKTFLLRVEELKDSAEPGAQTLYKTLGERGLSPKKIEAMRALCAAAEEHKVSATGTLPVSPEEIKKAKDAQLAALAALKLWYNDWATTFRGVLDGRAQIILGLMSVKRRKRADDSEPDEGEGDPEDGATGDKSDGD